MENFGGKKKTYKNFAKLSCNLTNAEYETILDECNEAIRLTKNEILEFMKKYHFYLHCQ
jgi:serine/threonine-protein kinase HipA